MENIRCNKTVYSRKDKEAFWEKKDYPSISQAKKANGPNSKTTDKPTSDMTDEHAS